MRKTIFATVLCLLLLANGFSVFGQTDETIDTAAIKNLVETAHKKMVSVRKGGRKGGRHKSRHIASLIPKKISFSVSPNDLKLSKRVVASLADVAGNLILEKSRGYVDSQIYQNAAPSVVLIIAGQGDNAKLGTGSLIGNDGTVITNRHVIEGYSSAIVVFKPRKGIAIKKQNAHLATVVKQDPTKDLALLRISYYQRGPKPLMLGDSSNVTVGQDVRAIGHPEGEVWTYTKGIVSQIRPDFKWQPENEPAHEATVIQTQTATNPGNSGGPLLNDKGEIIGINSFKEQGEGLNYAVSSDDVRTFLKTPVAVLQQAENALSSSTISPEENSQPDNDATPYPKRVRFRGEDQDSWCTQQVGGDKLPIMYQISFRCNGTVDAVGFDDYGGGDIDLLGLDVNHTGKITEWVTWWKDGKTLIFIYDYDGTGNPDLIGIDHEGNGYPDTYIRP